LVKTGHCTCTVPKFGKVAEVLLRALLVAFTP
jgi:hypothetical protein